MNNKPLLVIIALVLTAFGQAFGQQNAQFSQYMFNTLYYNPAYAGVEGVTTITAFHRSQWAGYQPTSGDPSGGINSQVISLNTPLLRLRSGFGLHVLNDRLGPLTNLDIQASFAYHLGIGSSKLSMGIRGGIYSQTVDNSQLRYVDPGDPLINAGRVSQIRPDFSAGVFYRARQYYLGVGFEHLMDVEFNAFGVDTLNNPLVNHITFTGGYDYDLAYKLRLTPTLLVQTDLNVYSFDIGVLATYNDTMWGGVSFRQQEAIVGMIGYSFFKEKSLKLGYAFDYVVVAQVAKAAASHEVMVTYSLPISSANEKKIIRTPRFRQ